MPNRVHVELNAAATNHRWRVNHNYSIPATTLFMERKFENYNQVELGRIYPLSGFKFGIETVQNPAIFGISHQLVFDWPARGISYREFLTGTPLEVIVVGDSFQMTGTDCLGWVFGCGDVRVYVDGDLKLTVAGTYADSDDVYDRRFNQSTLYSYTNGDTIWRGYRREDCNPGRGWDSADRTESVSAYCLGGWQWWNGAAWQAETTQVDGGMVPLPAPIPSWCPGTLGCVGTPPSVSGVTTWTMTCGSDAYIRIHYFLDSFGECLCDIRGGGQTIIPIIRWRHQGETRKRSSLVSTTPTFANLLVTRRTKLSCQGCFADITECNNSEAVTTEASTYCRHYQSFQRGTVDSWCVMYPGGVCPEGDIPCSPDIDTFCYYQGYLALNWDSPCVGASGGGLPADVDWDVHGTRSLGYCVNDYLVLERGSEVWPRNYRITHTKFAASQVRIKFNRFQKEGQQYVLVKIPSTGKIRGYRISDGVPDPATEFKPCGEDTPTMYDFEILNDNTVATYWIDGTTIYSTIYGPNGDSVVTKTSTGITNVNSLVNLCVREQAVHGGTPVLVLSYADRSVASGGTGRMRYRTSTNYVTYDVATQVDVSTVEVSYGVHECFLHSASRAFFYHTGGTAIYRRRFNALGTALESATAISPTIDTDTDFHVCEGFYQGGLKSIELVYVYLDQRRIALSLNEGIDWAIS